MRFSKLEGSWKEIKIGEILKIGSGKDYKHLENGIIPVYGTGGYMTSVDDYLYNGETVCIGRKGTIDKPFYYYGKLWTVDTLFYTHSFKNIIPKFLFYVFEQINWLKYNEASGVPSLSKKNIEQIKITIPEIEEQKRISILLSLIDDRISTQNKIIQSLESLMSGLVQDIFSQKLRFKDDDGNEFPDWDKKKICDLFTSLKGKGIPKSDIIENGENFCVLYGELYTTYKEVIYKVMSKTNNKNGLLSKKGDLLIPSSTTTTGIDLANVTAINFDNVQLGGDIIVMRAKKKINNIFYAYYLTNHKKHEIASRAQGITIVHLYFNSIKDLKIDFPCIEEQTKISNFLSSINKKIEKEKVLLKEYEEQKKYLLQNLFI